MIETQLTSSPFPFDITIFLVDLLRLALAIFLGSIVGVERQLAGQSAGLRTHVMVSLGAAVFTLAGIAAADGDPPQVARIVQGVAAGVGFLGAGAIVRNGGDTRIKGLTTAGSIWVSAALGTSAGLGEYGLAASATTAALLVLVVLRPLSVRLDEIARRSDYKD